MWQHSSNTVPEAREDVLQRIVVVRALDGLGDLLCAVPAFRSLRSTYPQAEITLIGLPSAQAIVERFSRYLDKFIAFPGFPGIPERAPAVKQLPAFLTTVQNESFDLALQMHGSGVISNSFTALLDARQTAGFFLPGQFRPNDQGFFPYPSRKHEIRRWLHLIACLGGRIEGEHLEFPVQAHEQEQGQQLLAAKGLSSGAYVCIHPGASEKARRWPPKRFAAVADRLADQGLQVVITGTSKEASITKAVTTAMEQRAINLTGKTSLGTAAVLLENARMLVSNDTGLSHLSAAVKTPSVVIFTASDPLRWAPLASKRHRAVGQSNSLSTNHQCSCTNGRRCLRDGCTAFQQQVREPTFPSVTKVIAQTDELLTHVYAT